MRGDVAFEAHEHRHAAECRSLNSVNPILVQGAAFGSVTMLVGFEGDITAQVPHGATVELDPAARTLRVF